MSTNKSALQTVKRLFQIGDVLIKVEKPNERVPRAANDISSTNGRSSHNPPHLELPLADDGSAR